MRLFSSTKAARQEYKLSQIIRHDEHHSFSLLRNATTKTKVRLLGGL